MEEVNLVQKSSLSSEDFLRCVPLHVHSDEDDLTKGTICYNLITAKACGFVNPLVNGGPYHMHCCPVRPISLLINQTAVFGFPFVQATEYILYSLRLSRLLLQVS